MPEVEAGAQVMLACEPPAPADAPSGSEGGRGRPVRERTQGCSPVELPQVERGLLEGVEALLPTRDEPVRFDPAGELRSRGRRIEAETAELRRIHVQATGLRAWRIRL